ncbi:helix-turn-helix domain-containing protein [Frigoriflavimonas asaccharolytica]|uniref:Excisionase family DNA binding protein n=1 Tax=Frigoriflavimonas asaccharolytica TaxID=2735899 RepID=A0A8J8K9Y4_9FLAO|nr:helix-turn-helix domain-containing protein [Frigoriflavimonas asaccharolytica]NRS93587.1 excisionase family DNA binding protein [Frigoriflavimonas asaccharolytica]
MEANEISFENLPKAVAHLVSEIAKIKFLVERKEAVKIPQKRIPIDIVEACRIIGKAKPTVYTLVRKRLIPCYKNGKKLYFFEDELLDWISQGRKKTMQEIEAEAKLDFGKNFKKIGANLNKN